MPAIAADQGKQAAFNARQRAKREKAVKARQRREKATADAFERLRKGIARRFGCDPKTITMIMCRRGRREQI